jgi:myxalamid-type polyketide synthase MxaB
MNILQDSQSPLALCGTDVVPGLSGLPPTLPEVLRRAAADAQAGPIVHLDGRGHARTQTLAALLADAEAVAGGLSRLELKAGDSAILLLDSSADVLPAFWGCILTGVTPVIAPLPPTFQAPNRGLEQLGHVWRLLGKPLLIGGPGLLESSDALAERLRVDEVRCADIAALRSGRRSGDSYDGSPNETAFYNLTSGSTGVPKCIALTHANLIQRAHGANLLGEQSADDVILNWLPFDHIGTISDWHIRCVLLGCRMVYATKESVIGHPLQWLDLIDQHRITHTWAPNFAYALICDRLAALRAEGQASPRWDLSCVAGMLTAGESVSNKVVEQFLADLKPFGLPATAVRPAFGMAELGSGITYQVPSAERPLRFCSVQRGSLQGRVIPTSQDAEDASTFASLGPPIFGACIRIVDEEGQVVSEGTVGLLQIRGPVVSPGYFRNPEANRVFHDDGWFESGDMGFLVDGELVITGRAKESIIIRGVNYGCGEIEELVNSVPGVEPSFTAACAVRRPHSDREELAVFLHTDQTEETALASILRAIHQGLVRQIGVRPDYLVPVLKEAIPKTAIGKLQRGELSRRFAEDEFNTVLETLAELQLRHDWTKVEVGKGEMAQSEIEKQVAAVWQDVLEIDQIGVHDNLFDLGGDSLLLAALHSKLQAHFGPRITLVEMFNYPSIHALASFLSGEADRSAAAASANRVERRKRRMTDSPTANDVAVIGMACRFPGARNLQQFWRNLCDGVESIQFFSEEEVLAAGVDPQLVRSPNYVKAAPVLRDVEMFDARFFGITAREATLMDPQQRVLLECAWETFEVAGYNPQAYPGSVGVYAGAVMNTYLVNNLVPARAFQTPDDASEVLTLDSMGGFRVMIANDKDYVPMRISYKLNLRGPSVNVQTACSTTLVAVHMAAQAVLAGECDMALAGGVSVKVPQEAGYLFLEDMIVSPDGHCRAFDADARGTLFGNGAGMVLLKRFDEAVADGDHIFAVIKGSAVNNDGSSKVGFLAPSQEGMATVISEAIAQSGVDPRTIGFVEAHGTGTALGDPIEIGALMKAFRGYTSDSGFCAVGSVKTNVGHLQIASGVAGFIKTVLSLYYGQIPATLHFTKPNPRIDFANSPFYVNERLEDWSAADQPRRAGVNSLGVGGTNAHVVLEEPPRAPHTVHSPQAYLLPLSARSRTALRALIGRYNDALEQFDDTALSDICFTASTGRVHFGERFAAVGTSLTEIKSALAAQRRELELGTEERPFRKQTSPRVGLLFFGLDAQPLEWARSLYEAHPRFRTKLDQCSELLANELPRPLVDVVLGENADPILAAQPAFAIPARFAIECALAEMWRDWGVDVAAILGHGLGEFAAACVAGVFGFADGLRLVSARARLTDDISKADGNPEATNAAVAKFHNVADAIRFASPRTPLILGRMGHIAGPEILTADYWSRQVQESPKLEAAMQVLTKDCTRFLEIVLRSTSSATARQIFNSDSRLSAECWLNAPGETADAWEELLETLSRTYVAGIDVRWDNFYRDLPKRRVVLPTYPFERKRFWIDRPDPVSGQSHRSAKQDAPPAKRSLLRSIMRSPLLKETIFETELCVVNDPGLADYRFLNAPLVPPAHHLAMACAAARQLAGDVPFTLHDVQFSRPLSLSENRSTSLQLVFSPRDQNHWRFELVALSSEVSQSQAGYTVAAEGFLTAGRINRGRHNGNAESTATVRGRCPRTLGADDFYRLLRESQLHLSPQFRVIDVVHVGAQEVLCRLRNPSQQESAVDPISTVLLDSCLQAMIAVLPSESKMPRICTAIETLRFLAPPSGSLWCHVRIRPANLRLDDSLTVDVDLIDETGRSFVELVGVSYDDRPWADLDAPRLTASLADAKVRVRR